MPSQSSPCSPACVTVSRKRNRKSYAGISRCIALLSCGVVHNGRQNPPPAKSLPPTWLWHSIFWGGLQPVLQSLPGKPVQREWMGALPEPWGSFTCRRSKWELSALGVQSPTQRSDKPGGFPCAMWTVSMGFWRDAVGYGRRGSELDERTQKWLDLMGR